MKRTVNYSLFGVSERYCGTARAVVWAHHHIFPGWSIKFYHDNRLDDCCPMLRKYAAAGLVELEDCGETPPFGLGALWRFKSVWEDGMGYALTRDIDSAPMVRDRLMVEEFIATGHAVHTVSDHPHHGFSMQAGMSGFNCRKFLKLVPFKSWDDFVKSALLAGVRMEQKESCPDQVALEQLIWPWIYHDVCEHRLKGVNFMGAGSKFDRVPNRVPPDVKLKLEDDEVLSPFMGCACFDGGRVISFLKKFGDPALVSRFEEAEVYK